MTEKLYYSNPKLTKWQTEITDKREIDDKKYILLKETAFYPEGGGQPSDRGIAGNCKVLDVQIEGNEILHEVDHWPETHVIECQIDWKRRYDHMQQHSGQHLLSAVFRELYQAETVSFHLGANHVTIDIELPFLTEEMEKAAEEQVNTYIYENRSILPYFVTARQLVEIPVVKKPKVTENIRIVEIEGIEFNPCGGTHVNMTGEIGPLKIFKTEKQKNSTRIYFTCGYRCLYDYTDSLDTLSQLSAKFNAGRKDILDRVEKLEADLKNQKAENQHLKEEIARFLSDSLLQSESPIVSSMLDKPFSDIAALAEILGARTDRIILLATEKDNKILLSHNGKNPIHCGKLFKEELPNFSGKGGGSNKKAQAGFTNTEDLLNFFQFLLKKLINK
ncbi:alanyl-tRNA editing protein [Bacillus massiliglaciei]|uniref:alanyl-tRNA editing protein n=1 Tax=Bacillus massiliglaciei TaxID=1816693 RepID=UPI000DA5F429|nr:DHHA1 domain-containing protein [Bacillus massiliglaciei]